VSGHSRLRGAAGTATAVSGGARAPSNEALQPPAREASRCTPVGGVQYSASGPRSARCAAAEFKGGAARRRGTSETGSGWPALLLLVACAACGDRDRGAGDAERAAASVAPARAASAADARLEGAARRVVGFLRGGLPFDAVALADTVELRVAPEGGGAVRRLSRDVLRDRAAWTVGASRRRASFVPPPGYSTEAVRVGRHFACHAQDLAARAPDLASRPHVGVRLQPPGAGSCLQSWNVTFVFDTTKRDARLVAALYDQFEW
jgi:hypothetical protein